MQYYTAKNEDYKDKVASGQATQADRAANQQLQQTYTPWVNDMNRAPLSTIMPTDPNSKGNTIVTTPRPTPGPATDTPGMNYSMDTVGPSDGPPGQNPPTPPSQPSTDNSTPLSGNDQGSTTSTSANNSALSNQPAPAPHPAVQRAGLLNEVATALAGGPRYKTVIDAGTGAAARTSVPLTTRQIGLAIALEAISGGLSGLAQKGTNATGAAAAAGLQQGQRIAQQRQANQQNQDQQAQSDYQNQGAALARKAATFESNSRTILNTAEAESRGADTIQKLADQNKQLIDDYDAAGVLHGRNMTQQELQDGMQSGKFNATEMLGPIDGYRLTSDGKAEATHAIITDPNAKVPLTAEQWNSYADAHVPGWPRLAPGASIPGDFKISGLQLARANEIKNSFTVAQQRHDEVTKALSESADPNVRALAANVPSIGSLLDNPKTGPGLATALQRYQKYVSHSDISHGMDLYESLQAMSQPSKPSPDGKSVVPNSDAPFASQIAQAFGGMDVLKAYHNEVAPLQIKNEGDAADMIASSEPGSRSYKYAQRWMKTYTQQQGAQAGARASAEEHVRETAANVKNSDAVLTTPDTLGFTPNVPGGLKEYDKRQNSFKKQTDELAKTEGTYQQFNDALNSIQQGNFTGAQSVVSLFDAIGLSATPLAGKGFRVNQNTIAEHAGARGWEGALQQKLLNAKAGDVITPQQVRDYAQIAAQARHSQYVNLANQVHNAGLNADFVLPTGNGQKIDTGTAQIFLSLTGNDPNRAMKAAQQKGWSF